MTAPPAYQADGKPDPSVVSQCGPKDASAGGAIAIANSGVPAHDRAGAREPRVVDPARQRRPRPHDLAQRDARRTRPVTGPGRRLRPRRRAFAREWRAERRGGARARAGNRQADALLGTRVDPRTEIARPANDASLSRLRDAGVDRVILDGADLTPRRRPVHARATLRRPQSTVNDHGRRLGHRSAASPRGRRPAGATGPAVPRGVVGRRTRATECPTGGGRPRAGRLECEQRAPRIGVGRAAVRPSAARPAHGRRPGRDGASGDERQRSRRA